MPVSDRAWVTVAWDENTSLRAIVLAKSLRKVVTHGTLVVLITPNISQNLRALLVDSFDVLQDVGLKSPSQNGLSVLDIAKISSWKLYWWKHCVFLEPNCIVLENSDELFNRDDLFSAPATCNGTFESNIFAFQPSYNVFCQLEKLSLQKHFTNASDLFKCYFQTWKSLSPQYFHLSPNNTAETKIASLIKSRPWENIERNGKAYREILPADLFGKKWLDLFLNDVMKNLLPNEASVMNLDMEKINTLKEKFGEETNANTTSKEVHNYLQNSIAVIGYSCKFPGANNQTEFWDLLKDGRDAITQMPLERLTESQLDDPKLTSVKAGFLKCPIDEFDAKFFGISPREAVFMDPQQRLLTEVAWEALENAGINPHSLKGSNTGVFTGVWTHEYESLLTQKSMGADFHHVVLGNAYSATSARVSYVLGLNGPNIVTESGCSSSMVSLHLACQSLRRNESDMTLVGGVNLLCAQFPHSEVSILAKDGHCKTFDEKADGFARGEGVGVLVLKKYSDAVRDGDRVMALVRGTGISNEGTTNSFGTPSKFCQEIAIKEALKESGVNPLVVDYVEAHGTGTPIGDPIEFGAIAAGYSGLREKPLIVGSVKTNIGHSEAAAGIAGIIKVMMAMENELIPLHRNLDTLNPNINLESVPAMIPTSAVEWPREKNVPRIAGVSSFGISGTNVHVIVQEPPHLEEKIVPCIIDIAREYEVLTLSAKSEESVKELAQKYISYFDKNPNVDLKDVVFTANNGRAHFRHRIAVVGKDACEMKQNLQKELYISGSANINTKPVVAFLFTGQGSQYTGMAKSLYKSNEIFKDTLDSCASILRNNCTISLYDILWNENLNGGASIDETLFSQIAIFCVEYALLKLWESLGVKPDYVLGHSVGEFAAAVAAGVLDLKDAITLVTERSRLIHNLPEGRMLAVRAPVETVRYSMAEFQDTYPNSNYWLDVAVINSNEEVVLAGKEDSMLAFVEFCKLKAVIRKTQFLAASHAFHSRDMEEIMEDFGNIASAMKYNAPKCNYISGSTGKLLEKEDFGAEYWQKHARYCVDFSSSIKSLESYGCNTFIEIGAHPILLALAMNNLVPSQDKEHLMLPSIRKTEHEWVTLMNSLAKLYVSGFNIEWKNIRSSVGRHKLALPTYQFQRQKFWVETNVAKDEIVLGGKVLHPLVGSKIPSAGNEHLYQHDLDLKSLAYLEDHQVANITILPGAGYLEMIVASSLDVFKSIFGKESDSLFVSQFLIEAPLELESNKISRVQTVAAPSDKADVVNVKIFLYCNLNGYSDEKGWKLYASAKVSTLPFIDEAGEEGKSAQSNNSIDIEMIKSRCGSETSTKEYYKKAPEIGILFGKTFQSVSKIWKGQNEALGLIPVPENAGNMQDYVYHPIVLDAMIQTFGIVIAENNEEKKDLFLPIGIDKFEMIKINKTSNMYAHVTWTEGQTDGHVVLYDENGKILSVMDGIRLVRTSLTSFLNVINAHNNKLPGMFTEIWRGRDGPLQSRVNYSKLSSIKGSKLLTIKDEHNLLNADYRISKDIMRAMDLVIYAEILKTFIEIGWNPQVSETFTAKQLMTTLIVSPSHEMLLERFIQIFCEENVLEFTFDNDENCLRYTVIKPIPPLNELETLLAGYYQEVQTKLVDDVSYISKLFKHTQSNLGKILLGERNAVSALFGGEVNPFQIYSIGILQRTMNDYIAMFICNFYEKAAQSESMVRILEVGGGTGVTASHVLALLKKRSIPFRYTFTDISQQFLEDAKKKFKDYSGMEFKILNLEEDPKEQGFAPFHYDVVIGSNVLHTVANIRETMKYIRHLMVPSGLLCAMEMFRPCRYADMIFGVFDGYWRFKDFDLRPSHCTISQQKWEQVLSECQFENFECPFPDVEITSFFSQATDQLYSPDFKAIKNSDHMDRPSCVLIFDDNSETSKILRQKLNSVGSIVVRIIHKSAQVSNEKDKYVFTVDPVNEEDISNVISNIVKEFSIHTVVYFWSITDNRDQRYICQGLIHLTKILSIQSKDRPKLMVVTRGNNFIGDQGKVCPSGATADGILTSFRNECVDKVSVTIDLDPDRVDAAVESQELFYEIWSSSSNEEKHVAFRNTRKYISRFTALEKPPPPLRIPTQQRYCLIVPTTKNLNDVTYRPVDKAVLQPTELEIAVKTTALNFRDIFVILKPPMYSSLFESVGTDFSGIISDIGSEVTKFKIGDEVFGVSNNTSVASHVVVPQDLVMMKPKEFSFADACTLPSVFLTAYLCLHGVGKLQKGETILIHVASGGVGLIAIQLAKLIGANIIATAGSKRKRAYLRSIGIEHVFHSRDISYGDEIERVTNGKGVDMVLNSITGVNFKETSLRVCAPNARFVEMGKVNIWQPEDVKQLRPDVQYTIVDLEKANRTEKESLVYNMDRLFKNGSIEPLPYTRFEGAQIKEALNYFLKAQHIGKVVVAMPEVCINSPVSKHFSNDIIFNSGSTYLITGGLGGIGLEVAKWMAKSGARNLVLVARSKPDEKTVEILNHLNSQGCKTLAYQVDVGDFDECKNLFQIMCDPKLGLPPLRGVIHSAGTLADDFLRKQTWEKFDKVFNAKVKGGWNLHDLTKNMRLEFFVLFSSMAGPFGAPAQANHSAANCFLASLARYRHSIGLPAQAIDWGAWSEVGAATKTAYGNEGMFGVKPFTPNQGLSTLKYIITRPLHRVGVVQCDFQLVSDYLGSLSKYVEEVVNHAVVVSSTQTAAETDAFWLDIKDLDLEDRTMFIRKLLENIIRRTLKLPDSEQLDEHQSYSEMGLDSLMAVEMRNKLQLMFGKHITLNPTSLMDYPTLATLSKYLAEMTLTVDIETIQPAAEKEDSPQTETTEDEELKNLITEDSILPDHIKDVGGCVSPSDIETVLLTGATGNLGVYLLKEIASTKNVKVICLLRAKTVDIARKRLKASLKKVHLLSDVDINSIDIVIGNVAEKNLGLSDEIYANLSTKVDAIVHCAAHCHHFKKYQKSIVKSDVRSVNTLGTLHVLELASTKKTKRVIYPGSFSSANELTEDGYLSENIPSIDNLGEGINFGYGISKLVAEKLIGQAIERGIPCTIVRLPTLLGHSETGLFSVESNLFMRIILTLAQLEIMPNLGNTNWYLLPIDLASNVICQLMFNYQVETGMYNLMQPDMLTITEFVQVSKTLGWNISVVPPADFDEKVRSSSNEKLGISYISTLVSKEHSLVEYLTSSCPAIKMGFEKGKSVYNKSSKIEKIVPNFYDMIPKPAATFSKHIAYAKATGVLDTFIKM